MTSLCRSWTLPTVLLKPGEADRILAGHPWIYHGSVLRLTQPAADGELVQVKDHRQRFLGTGFYNSRSKINVRVPLAGAGRGEPGVLRGTHSRSAGGPAKALAGRDLLPRRECGERFSERPHRG